MSQSNWWHVPFLLHLFGFADTLPLVRVLGPLEMGKDWACGDSESLFPRLLKQVKHYLLYLQPVEDYRGLEYLKAFLGVCF